MHGRRWAGSLALVLLVLIPASPALAGYIRLDVRPTAELIERFLTVSLTVTNSGDEPAFGVRVTVEGEGRSVSLPALDQIGVGEQKALTARVPVGALQPGNYSAIIRTGYTDGNRYPFSTVTVVSVSKWVNPPSPVTAVMTATELAGSGDVQVRVSNVALRSHQVRVRLVTPSELIVDPPEVRLLLQGGQEEPVRFIVRNDSALPGSSYAVFAILDAEAQDLHTSTALSTQVSVVALGGALPHTQLVVLLAALPVAALALLRLLRRLSSRYRLGVRRSPAPRRVSA